MSRDIETLESLPEWAENLRNVDVAAAVLNRLMYAPDGEYKAYTYKQLAGTHGADTENIQPDMLTKRALDYLHDKGVVEQFGGYYWVVDEERARQLTEPLGYTEE